jgi:alpha-2-macroglobulin
MVTTNYLTHLQEYLQQNDATQWRGDLVAVYMASAYRMLKQDSLADDLIKGYHEEQDVGGYYSWYDTSLGRNAQYLYLLARHFPERLKNVPDSVLGGVLDPVIAGDYNTLSSAYAIIAFGAYGKSMAAMQQGHIEIGVRDAAGKSSNLASVDGARATADLPLSAVRVDFASRGIAKLFYTVSQAGFDDKVPAKEESDGIEVTREYQDAGGKSVTSAPLGAELTVHLRVRTTDGRGIDNVALLDLLPGGFEVQRNSLRGTPAQSAGGGDDEEGDSQSSGEWNPDYADIREDRVVFYGSIGPQMHEIVYKVKVTSPGKFLVPPVYAGAMYDHTVFAHSAPGSFEVSDVK